VKRPSRFFYVLALFAYLSQSTPLGLKLLFIGEQRVL